jgi:hypothetical protein
VSRINRARIVDGDQTTAASLNDRFDDFTQSNEVDQFNLRDGAVDMPQLKKSPAFQAPFMQTDVLGKSDMLHAAPVSINADGSTPYTSPSVIQDGAANPTIATYGSGGLTIGTSDVLRIYWSLSVRADLTNSPWDDGFQFNVIAGSGGGGNIDVSTSAGCFVAWLQWDITSNGLTNWTEVPGQGDFKTAIGSYHGNTLQNCQATTVIPLWSYWLRNLNNGDSSAGTTAETKAAGWRGVSGAWHYRPPGSRTIYGLRVVLLGVMHPRRATAGSANALVLDVGPAGDVDLEYTGGRLVTLVNRVK